MAFYRPAVFREDRLPVLHAFIRQSRLATLITVGAEGLEASHVPVLLQVDGDGGGAILGHLARGNGQWRRFDATVPALMTFLGPEAYVTPSWYRSKAETGRVVPTWNYAAVHVRGALEIFDEPGRLHELVSRLTNRHEAGRAEPWAVADAPADFIQAQLKGIVGFRLPIESIEGKWKMSQNRTAEDRAGVAEGLERDGEGAVAEMVAGRPETD